MKNSDTTTIIAHNMEDSSMSNTNSKEL